MIGLGHRGSERYRSWQNNCGLKCDELLCPTTGDRRGLCTRDRREEGRGAEALKPEGAWDEDVPGSEKNLARVCASSR